MSQPATGTTWNRGGYADIDPRLIARGGLQCVLVRDNRGQATNISPFSTFSGDFASATVGFSPFAQDGELRDDLIAAQLDNGQWVSNPSSNEGFLAIGSQTEDGGAERNPTTSSDDLRILQSNWPVDTAITEKGLTALRSLKSDRTALRPGSVAAASALSSGLMPSQENASLSTAAASLERAAFSAAAR